MVFLRYTAGTEALRIDSSGFNVKYNSLALYLYNESNKTFFWGGVSSFTYLWSLSITGFQLWFRTRRIDSSYSQSAGYFGGTAAANLLDDYEEGTWTPVSKSDSTTIGTTVNFAKYVKIGSWVYVTAFVTRSDAASLTGNFTVEGLPYQPYAGSAQVNGAFW
jgi:hypothetical protein